MPTSDIQERDTHRGQRNTPGVELEPRAWLVEVGVGMSLRKESPLGDQLECSLEGGAWGAGVVSELEVTCTPSRGHFRDDAPRRGLQSWPHPSRGDPPFHVEEVGGRGCASRTEPSHRAPLD